VPTSASKAIVVISFRMTDSPELGPLSRFVVVGRLDHKVPKPHVSFRCSKRAPAPIDQKAQLATGRQPRKTAWAVTGNEMRGLRSALASPPVPRRRLFALF
jgi:hypothetical protein